MPTKLKKEDGAEEPEEKPREKKLGGGGRVLGKDLD